MTAFENVAATIEAKAKKTAHTLAIPKNPNQKPLSISLAFTFFMSAGMCALVSLINLVLHNGFGVTAYDWFHRFIVMWPIAFVVSATVSDYLVKRMLMPFFAPKIQQKLIKKNLYSLCKLSTMVPLMSAVSIMVISGIPSSALEFFLVWAISLPLSIVIALVLNLFLVGPAVKKFFSKVFHQTF